MADKPDDKRDDDAVSPEALARLTQNLSTLAEAMPSLLEQFRALARSLAEGAIAGKIVDVVEEQRLAAFVQLVKLLGREHEGPAEALALEPRVAATLAVVRTQLGRARIVKVYAPAPLVIATERQLGQLLLELFANVARALVEASDEARLTVRVGTTDAGWALVELEPSTGLTVAANDATLARAREIVGELGGRLRVAREPGQAVAALRVELPPARAPETNIRA